MAEWTFPQRRTRALKSISSRFGDHRSAVVRLALPALGLVALVAAGCSGGGGEEPAPLSTATATEAAPLSTATPSEAAPLATAAPTEAVGALGFPTGPAVTVAADYAPPADHVPSTGAYLPANGKPTLVYVDAIW